MRKLLPLLLCTFWLTSTGQDLKLSPQARVSLITCGPWQGELYSAFGHSAIRVYDPILQIDLAFNYGTFDFNQPNFYLNFARGRNLYRLSVQDYPMFRDFYVSYNRFIHEQVLNLDAGRKDRLFAFLQNNSLPANRSYYYDYFYDNCSTRPRDVIKAVLGDSVVFDADPPYLEGHSIRDLTDLYLQQQPWGDLGIDICLGLPMDKTASATEYMFLPDYLETGFDLATVTTPEGRQPLVLEKNIVYEQLPEPQAVAWTHPWVVFGTLFLITLWLTWGKTTSAASWIDRGLFLLTGMIGLMLALLWFVTDHRAAAWNFNLLWAMPLNLLFPFLVAEKRKKYFKAMTLLTAALLVTWAVLPQALNPFLIPLVAALACRYWANSR